MPSGWERINATKSTPNKNIVFIKPRPGADESTSKDFLERIAAQCLPIMNKHHLTVISLEEYEPNLEFWGRNFNNGEVIQLVLKSPSTGRWLPFKFVQMIMMHELAHNKQMNHSKAFWGVRNEFSAEMKLLWDRGYTGDGLWGIGMLLKNGVFSHEELGDGEVFPEHMCGGTFKSQRGKRRKPKPQTTYKERHERIIKKKFGSNGIKLGADEEAKAKLEERKRAAAKPRVAGSARGRGLRAAAALARFETNMEEPQNMTEGSLCASETESDVSDDVFIKTEPGDALDIDGKRLIDLRGQGLVKVCEAENKYDERSTNELLELQSFGGIARHPQTSQLRSQSISAHVSKSFHSSKDSNSSMLWKTSKLALTTMSNSSGKEKPRPTKSDVIFDASAKEGEGIRTVANSPVSGTEISCLACSVENEPTALTCIICSNVLQPDFFPNSWRCRSLLCKSSEYINAADVGLCGICATRKCPTQCD